MRTFWIGLALLSSASVSNAVAATGAALCDLSFLDQTLEPDQRVIQSTLIKILTNDFPIFFSGRFNSILIAHLYHELSFFNVTSHNATFWALIPKLRTLPQDTDFLNRIAQITLNQITKDALRMSRVGFFETYPGFTDETYENWQNVIQQINDTPSLNTLALNAIHEIILTADDWGPKLKVMDWLKTPAKKHVLSQERRDQYVRKYLHTRDFLPKELYRHSYEPAPTTVLELSKAYLVAREHLLAEQLRLNFNDRVKAHIANRSESLFSTTPAIREHAPYKNAAIRSVIASQNSLDHYIDTLQEIAARADLTEATLQQQLASAPDLFKPNGYHHEALAASLLRLRTFKATLHTSLTQAVEAQSLFDELFGYFYYSIYNSQERRKVDDLIHSISKKMGIERE